MFFFNLILSFIFLFILFFSIFYLVYPIVDSILYGEIIQWITPEIGLLHRGTEKLIDSEEIERSFMINFDIILISYYHYYY